MILFFGKHCVFHVCVNMLCTNRKQKIKKCGWDKPVVFVCVFNQVIFVLTKGNESTAVGFRGRLVEKLALKSQFLFRPSNIYQRSM